MSIGNNLYNSRKKCGMTQEEVAKKLNISRQTLSKWESGDSIPNIGVFKELARIYSTTMDRLAEYDPAVAEIEKAIENTGEEVHEKVDWNKVWGKKYPVLLSYRDKVDCGKYASVLCELLTDLQKTYGYNDRDTYLVLKDILSQVWFGRKGK